MPSIMKDTFHIQWHITNLCNLKCIHCYHDDFSKNQNRSLEDLKAIFLNISNFLQEENKDLVIDITGGEPFLYKDWKELFSYLYKSSCVKELGIITNGLFLDEEILNFLEDFHETKLKISAEAFEKETFEKFRGKGNFEKFIKTINLLKEKNFEKTLMFTIMEQNVLEVEKLFHFIEEYKINHFIVERFIPWGEGRKIINQVVSLKKWIKTIKILLNKTGNEEDIYPLIPYRGFRVTKENGAFELYGSPCIVGTDGISVMPDGSVFPCRRFPLKIGNLLEESLYDIWNNSYVLKKLKDKKNLKGKCHECKIEDCNGCRALAFAMTGDYMAEDPLCMLSES
ncbi:MAG: radical SAM protein [Candidatus Eremiobacterota bacterium]